MKVTKERLMQIINEELDEARSGDKEEYITAALTALQNLLVEMPEKGAEINVIIASVRALGGLVP